MIHSSCDIEHDRLKLVILGHFLLFYQKRTQKIKILKKMKKNFWRYHHYSCVPKITIIWFTVLRYRLRWTYFFVILGHFFLFPPLMIPKNKNLKKIERVPGDIIILHMCTINEDHMMYYSWDIRCDRQNFLSFWTIFCFFIVSLTIWKIKTLKNWKGHLEVLLFYTCAL